MENVKRDINVCKKCEFFKEVNDPITGKGWHWGVGCYCSCVPLSKGVPWSKENKHAVSEEEFVKATILFANEKNCKQNK